MDTSKPTYQDLEKQISELKRQNEYLRQKAVFNDENKENVLRQLVENIDDVFWIRTDEQMIYVNPAFEKVWGILCEEIYLNPPKFTETIHPDDRQAVFDIFKSKVFKEKGLFNFDYRIIRNDKEIRWINAKSLPVFDENGKIIRRVGIARDITERKLEKEKLLRILRQQQLILENDPALIIFKDTKNNILRITDTVAKITGMAKQEIEGRPSNEIYPYMAEKYYQDDIEVMKSRSPKRGIIEPLPAKNGTQKWLLTDKVPYFDDNNNVAGVIVFSTDITELKKHQIEISRTKDIAEQNLLKYESLVHAIPDLIFVMNKSGTYTECYSANSSDLYQPAKYLLNKKAKEVLPDYLAKLTQDKIDTVLTTKQLQIYSYQLEINNENKWFEVRMVYMNKNHVLAIVRNITKDKLSEQRLYEAKEKAEESDRLKSAFLRNISHEFRTPMNGILGFSDLLIKQNKTEEQRKCYAEIVKESCEKLLDIVTDTIDISEIQSNITTIKDTDCSLKEIIQEIIEQLKPKIDKKGLQFTYKTICNEKELILKTDRQKIYRSLKHLIDNAIKFTNSGKIELICESDNQNISITINDTGIGISAEMQKVIFEPFRQVELDLCRNYGGNGVGLSLVKSYIEMLGGSICLKSEINKGTSVKVTLPLNSIKTTSDEQIETEKKSFIWSEKNILIVEDEAVNYLYLEELLLETGSKLLYAKNGQEAVDFCRNKKKIDLILMDLKMPIMNGYEATKLIKEFRAEIPIIAQTAYALEKDIDKIKESGFDDYLAKPYEQKKLLMKIEKYI